MQRMGAYDEAKNIGAHACNNISSYSILPKLSNKLSAKVICKFDGFETAHRKRQKAIFENRKLIGCLHIWLHIAQN